MLSRWQRWLTITLALLTLTGGGGGDAHSGYSLAGQESEGNPHDAFSLDFRKISFDYGPQKPDGSLAPTVHGGWDLAKNAKV